MSLLPSAETPLHQHSLFSLERWLHGLGAEQNEDDPCIWTWHLNSWSAEIRMEQDELCVSWLDSKTQCRFPYGLSRKDIENALKEGP